MGGGAEGPGRDWMKCVGWDWERGPSGGKRIIQREYVVGRIAVILRSITETYSSNGYCKPTFPTPFQLDPGCTGSPGGERWIGAGEAL